MATTNTAAPRTHPRLAVQAFWLTFAKFISAVLNILIPVLLVRILSQHDFGVYKQVFLFLGTTTSFAAFSVGVSAFYYMPRQPQRGGQIVLNIFVYNLIAGLVPLLLLLFYPQFLNLVFRSGDLEPYALLLGVFVMLQLDASLVEMIPTAMQDVRNSTLFVTGSQTLKVVAVVVVALIFRSVRSIVLACMVTGALSVAVLVRYLYRTFGPFWKHFDRKFFIEQLAYAAPLGAYGIVWVFRKDLDNYFVGAMYSPAQYAIYAIGWMEVPLIQLFIESMLSVMVVRISALHQEGRTEDIRNVLASAINRLATVQFPIYAILLVAGRDLIVFFYTKTYAASARIFYITITLIVLNVFMYDPIVRAYMELRKFILLVRIGVLAGLAIALAPVIHHFGMIGAAVIAVLGELTERLIIGRKVCQTIEATWHDARLLSGVLRAAGVATVAALIALGVRNALASPLLLVRLALTGISFGAVYLAGFYFLRLPGYDIVTKDRLLRFVQSARARLRGAT
ncbi:MAG: oligosaccharide flippase family protein [Candidatus Korobacteraceae bacterium]